MKDKYRKMDYIANGIHAASKINTLRRAPLNENTRTPVTAGNMNIINEVLKTIVEYYPGSQKKALEYAVNQSNLYRHTYKTLKHNLFYKENSRSGKHKFVTSLQILHPLLGSREKTLVEKILKLYEVFS